MIDEIKKQNFSVKFKELSLKVTPHIPSCSIVKRENKENEKFLEKVGTFTNDLALYQDRETNDYMAEQIGNLFF